ncbi:Hypothetical protein I595_482 [Croceitalea dokdonensis DOKDO 023]|uniref:Uncharacterized protein n=1 Tax=Croceitalea dokdonensis DOKDO 023 TaxID=1300341 RepID=A0A0P7AZA6_9FLAO|nr:Hypothetical protein I595_482 [Croceitalea dokdonensis DOKDO 023]
MQSNAQAQTGIVEKEGQEHLLAMEIRYHQIIKPVWLSG